MSALRTGCLSLTLLSGVAYLGLLSVPNVRHKESVSEALVVSQKRFQDRKPKVEDRQVNGFLSPNLELLWGGSGESSKGPANEALQAWTGAYSSQSTGSRIDHAALLKGSDKTYIATRSDFAKWVPEILTAFEKPVFQPVNKEFRGPSAAAKSANYMQLRSLTMGLIAYAESLLAEGNVDEAVTVYEGVLRLGFLVSDDMPIVATAFGISIQGLALESVLSNFDSNSAVTASRWREFSATIALTAPTPLTLRRAVENDIALGTEFLNQPRMALDGDGKTLRGLFLLPGMRAREQRIYQNTMGDILAEVQQGGIESGPPSHTWSNILRGVTGKGVSLLVPDYRQPSARLLVHSAKMCGLAAFAGACAYQVQYGRLPNSLADLDILSLRAPGGVAWSEVRGVTLAPEAGSALVVVDVKPEVFSAAGFNVEFADQIESQRSAFFRVRPAGFTFAVQFFSSASPVGKK